MPAPLQLVGRGLRRNLTTVSGMAIHYEKDDEHVVLVTIDRPEARNSADMEHFKQLRESWERFRDDDDAWIAIITGVGDAFFTGADLKRYIPEITKFQKQIADEGLQEINGYRLDDGTKSVLRNFELNKPVIAAVNGFCTAGGMEMIGGIDIRVACPEAKFAVMEPKRGLFAGGGTTVRLPRQIPWPLAMEFLLCADLIPAERAYEMGLLNAVVPRDQLLDTAYAFARRITANAPLAVQATKQSALLGLYHDEHEVKALREAVKQLKQALDTISPDDAHTAKTAIATASETLDDLAKQLRTAFEKESRLSSKIFQTEDAKEGPKAFAEKRPPNWQAK
jgi:enoyl-CoA hydratase